MSKLAIAIPTYNRSEILKFNLLQILDELIQFSIPVYISDDSTNDDTQKVINELIEKHNLIFYYKNPIRLGHDLNFWNTISLPGEDYVWYMGDSVIIKKDSIANILDIIKNEDYDFISCNADDRKLNLATCVFNNNIELFDKLCWHLTLTGVTIYNRNSVLKHPNFDVSKFKNFPQTAFIFEFFALKSATLFWTNERMIQGNKGKKSYWSQNIFEVFIDDFKTSLYNLNKFYSVELLDKVIKEHSVNTGIFSYSSFLKLRMNGIFNYKKFLTYKNDINKYSNTNPLVLLGFSVFSITILKFLYKIFNNTK